MNSKLQILLLLAALGAMRLRASACGSLARTWRHRAIVPNFRPD